MLPLHEIYLCLKAAILVLTGSLNKVVLPDVLPNFLHLSCQPLLLTSTLFSFLSHTAKSYRGPISLGSMQFYSQFLLIGLWSLPRLFL